MIESAEGTIGNQPLPKEKVEEWVDKKADPFLKPYDKRVIDNREFLLLEKRYNLFKILVLILAIAVAGIIYLSYNGNFKTDVICEAPNITIPSCPTIPQIPSCPSCPDCNCGNITCGNLTFPNSLNLNVNSS